MGYRILDDVEVPQGYKSTIPSDPYPINIFGEEKPIPDKKIGKYLNKDFFYYNNIYENIINFGLPYSNWLQAPNWLLELIKLFKQTDLEYQNYLSNKYN